MSLKMILSATSFSCVKAIFLSKTEMGTSEIFIAVWKFHFHVATLFLFKYACLLKAPSKQDIVECYRMYNWSPFERLTLVANWRENLSRDFRQELSLVSGQLKLLF